jgi:hypothetical protein
MTQIETLMHANLFEVFGERDAERRRAAIARTYAEDVQFVDPEGTVVGHEALDAKAQQLLEMAPDFVFSAAGPVHELQDLGYLAWNLGPEGQPPVAKGMDIGFVVDGRIAKMYTILTAG